MSSSETWTPPASLSTIPLGGRPSSEGASPASLARLPGLGDGRRRPLPRALSLQFPSLPRPAGISSLQRAHSARSPKVQPSMFPLRRPSPSECLRRPGVVVLSVIIAKTPTTVATSRLPLRHFPLTHRLRRPVRQRLILPMRACPRWRRRGTICRCGFTGRARRWRVRCR